MKGHHVTEAVVAQALAVAVAFADGAASGRVRLAPWAYASGLDLGSAHAVVTALQHRGLAYWDREADTLIPTTSGRGWLRDRTRAARTEREVPPTT